MQRSKCQECGLVSAERDLCPRCKSPLYRIRAAAPAALAQIDTAAKGSFSPLKILLTAMVVIGSTFAGYNVYNAAYRYFVPPTQADLDRELMESPDFDYLIGGPDGQSREDKLKALKKSSADAIARGERDRQAQADKEATIRLQNYEGQKQVVPGPPQHMVPMPNNPQAMVPAPR